MRQSSGTTPVSSDFWNISCSSGEISVASSFRILGDVLSGPGALYGFNCFSKLPVIDIILAMCVSCAKRRASSGHAVLIKKL